MRWMIPGFEKCNKACTFPECDRVCGHAPTGDFVVGLDETESLVYFLQERESALLAQCGTLETSIDLLLNR